MVAVDHLGVWVIFHPELMHESLADPSGSGRFGFGLLAIMDWLLWILAVFCWTVATINKKPAPPGSDA